MSQTPLADELARISREEFDRYLTQFRPLEQSTIDSLDEATVGRAMDDAQGDAVRARASLARMRERYGVGTDPLQAAGEARQNALSGVLGRTTAGNQAILADRDNTRQTLAGLLNQGQALRQQALGGYGSAASLEGQRASADSAARSSYTQQKAANKAQTYQSAASLGAMALTAAVLM